VRSFAFDVRTWLVTGAAFVVQISHAQLAGIPVDRPVPGFHDAHISHERTLRYKCAGHGAPTVVIEQGMGISVETVFS